MKKFLVLSACLSSFLIAKTVDFNTVLNEALKNNLSLKAKKLNIAKAKADLNKAKGMNYGKLVLSSEIARTNDALYVFGMKLESREATFKDFGFSDFLTPMGVILGDLAQENNNKAAQELQQMSGLLDVQPKDLNNPGSRTNVKTKLVYEVPLFTGFKLTYAKEMAKLQIKANKYKYSSDKKALAIEVLKAYNGAVAAKYFINALKTAKKTTSSFVQMIKDFYNQGMATKIDLLQAQKRDNEVKAMLIKAKNKYQLALSYLQFLTDDSTIDGVEDFKVIIPANKSLKELIKIALNNRSDLKWMKANVETMAKKVKFDKADKYPMVGAHLEYGFNDNRPTLSMKKDYYLAAVGLKWNLFDKSTDANVQKSKIAALQTDYYYQYMKKGIALDVKQKYLDYKAKHAIIQEKITNKELADEILKKYTYMYKQGMINITLLLMKEAEDRKANAELIKARYDEAIAAAELKKAIGDLLKESK